VIKNKHLANAAAIISLLAGMYILVDVSYDLLIPPMLFQNLFGVLSLFLLIFSFLLVRLLTTKDTEVYDKKFYTHQEEKTRQSVKDKPSVVKRWLASGLLAVLISIIALVPDFWSMFLNIGNPPTTLNESQLLSRIDSNGIFVTTQVFNKNKGNDNLIYGETKAP